MSNVNDNTERKAKTFTMVMPPDLRKRVVAAAKADRRSVGGWIKLQLELVLQDEHRERPGAAA